VLPGIAMHAVNNALIGTLAQRPGLAGWLGIEATSGAIPWAPVLVGTAVMAAALALLWSTTTPAEDRMAGARTPAPAAPVPSPP
jgi:hypothetical protein